MTLYRPPMRRIDLGQSKPLVLDFIGREPLIYMIFSVALWSGSIVKGASRKQGSEGWGGWCCFRLAT